MLFNSFEFAVFLPVVFSCYWFLLADRRNLQNVLIVFASYLFYGWWDWRFLSLIVISTLVDYYVGIWLHRTHSDRGRLLLLFASLSINLGFLAFFKYYNFFIDSLASSIAVFGSRPDVRTLSIVLPVGISFYTFQTLSYSIDVYKREIEPTTDLVAFAAYVSFFPQLVAGPIERAARLLPQFLESRRFSYDKARDGLRQILWGLFKKVAVADSIAPLVNVIFSDYLEYHWIVLFLGAVLFSFQIYGDFSGYSDIAIGVAKLFGFSLMRNFEYPYFSRDIAEFWRRWHISLSSWFRDYIYIPLGGSRGSVRFRIRNILVIFLVSGLWHGANWTFVLWGLVNGLLVAAMSLIGKNRSHREIVAEDSVFPTFQELAQMLLTFTGVSLIWILFRAPTIGDAYMYLVRLFSFSSGAVPALLYDESQVVIPVLMLVAVEFANRRAHHGLGVLPFPVPVRWGFYYALIAVMFLGGSIDTGLEFIYFAF